MADLPLKSSGGRVDILLGLDHAHLMIPEEIRRGETQQPVASKTKLGWMVRGVIGADLSHQRVAARMNHAFSSSVEVEQELVDQVRHFCDTEAFGTEHKDDCLSAENRAAIDILKTGIRKLSTGYEVPLLWRDGEPKVVDNRIVAEHCTEGLIRRFEKDPTYEVGCRMAMEKTFDEGYAVRLRPEEMGDGPSNYFAVFGTGKRGSPKLRIVFDVASRFQGTSFNDRITSGPILQNSLQRIIIRFREGDIAWAADIQAMFSRIPLRPEDWKYHRFLWPERDGTVSTCEMRRLTFGVSCSPCVAIYNTWKAGEDAGTDMRHAADAIRSNFYIDDYLGSSHSIEDSIRIATDVKATLAAGDFHLMGRVSNSTAFMDALNPDQPAMESRDLGADENEMVVEMSWKPTKDVLGFRADSVDGSDSVDYTRVGLVSKTAGIFDPIGLAAPVTVKAKIRLRELGFRGLKWSDAVVGDEFEWWKSWVASLRQLVDLEVPRCLFPKISDLVSLHLHTFGDASEEAYAAVTYTRAEYANGEFIVRLVKLGAN